jgi:uncharacterized membrane protein YdbT with pleckstrin-like domain
MAIDNKIIKKFMEDTQRMINMQKGEYYSLGPKTFLFLSIQRTMAAAIFFIVALIIMGLKGFVLKNNTIDFLPSIINWIIVILFLLGFLMLAIGLIITRIQYKTSGVMIDDYSFHIVRGILSRKETSIPYRRIQSVEIKQSLLYRILNIAYVSIATTTSLEEPSQIENDLNEEVIPNIDYSLAMAIEDTLTREAEIENIEIKK